MQEMMLEQRVLGYIMWQQLNLLNTISLLWLLLNLSLVTIEEAWSTLCHVYILR